VRRDGARMPNLSRLAQFVLTGEGSPEPDPETEPLLGEAPRRRRRRRARPAGPQSQRKWQRPVAYVLWGLALAAGGVAVYEHLAGRRHGAAAGRDGGNRTRA
jgi:hypothetical protein